VGRHLLARRKSGVQIPSPPPPTLQVRAPSASRRRRSLHGAAALRPQPQVTVQPKGSQRPADPGSGLTQGPRSVVTASCLPMGDPRTHPSLSRSAWRTATTSHDDDQVQVDPRWAQPGLRQPRAPGPKPRQTTRRHGHGGRLRRPRPSQPCGGLAPPPHPATSCRRTPRTPQRTDAGGRTPDSWTLRRRTGHRSRGHAPADTGRSHRTLDTGHRMPDTNADTVTTAQPASGPLGRHAERPYAETPTVFVLSHYQPAARPLRRPSGAPAHCSPQTNFGSRVERETGVQVLWRVHLRVVLWRAEWCRYAPNVRGLAWPSCRCGVCRKLLVWNGPPASRPSVLGRCSPAHPDGAARAPRLHRDL
jgi:hypothetical protein